MKNLLSLLALWGQALIVFALVVFLIATVQQFDEGGLAHTVVGVVR